MSLFDKLYQSQEIYLTPEMSWSEALHHCGRTPYKLISQFLSMRPCDQLLNNWEGLSTKRGNEDWSMTLLAQKVGYPTIIL